MSKIDLTGKTFDRLTVIGYSHNLSRYKYWLCKCICGKETTATTSNLVQGSVRSCGCRRKGCRGSNPDSNKISIYNKYKLAAKRRNIEFNLTKEEFYEFLKKDCYYCFSSPSNQYRNIMYNGVDRFNNNIGYSQENCVSCCKNCNLMKRDLTFEEFLNHIKKVLKYHG